MISYLPRCWENCIDPILTIIDCRISPQMLGELLGGVLAPPVRVEYRLPPVVYGHLRAAISIASHTRGRCRVLSPQSRTRLLSWCSSPGTVARQIGPLPGAGTGGCRPPTCSPGLLAAGARAGPGRDASPGPRPGRWHRTFRCGCAAWRALGAHDGCAPCPGSSQRLCGPRRRGPFGTRRVPRELLKTHSIKALSSFLRRTVLDGSRPSQA